MRMLKIKIPAQAQKIIDSGNDGLDSMKSSLEKYLFIQFLIWIYVDVEVSKHTQKRLNVIQQLTLFIYNYSQKKVELSSVFKQWRVYSVKIKFGCS